MNNYMNKRGAGLARALAAAVTVTLASAAGATPLTYTPVNPNFGGNPLNGNYLLSSAQAQNKHEPPSPDLGQSELAQQTPLDRFNQTLEQSMLSRISAAATSQLFDNSGNLIPGTVNTQDFSIVVADAGSGLLTITTTDKTTGQTTSFQVSSSTFGQ